MIEMHEVPSRALRCRRQITVWTASPPRDARARLPVLYLNDGQNLFDPARAFAGVTWGVAETAARLVRRGVIPPLAIVGIDHGGASRAREYLPVEDDRNPMARGPMGDAYVRFLVDELMPFVAARYGVSRSAALTGIGGSSYGAIAALYAVLREPGRFGRLLLESPSLYVGRGHLLRRARRAPRWPSRIYLGVGTAETNLADRNEETVRNVLTLAGILRDAGVGPRRLRLRVEEGANHSEGAWAARLPDALTFLYGQPATPRGRARV